MLILGWADDRNEEDDKDGPDGVGYSCCPVHLHLIHIFPATNNSLYQIRVYLYMYG